MASESPHLLYTPSFQEAFWAGLTPDLRALLDVYEAQETWTYADDLPEPFFRLAEQLPEVASVPVTGAAQPVARALIPLLANLPFRKAISALSYLDSLGGEKAPGELGWGVATFLEAASIARQAAEDPLFAEAKNLADRMQVVVRASIAASLFTDIHALTTALEEDGNA